MLHFTKSSLCGLTVLLIIYASFVEGVDLPGPSRPLSSEIAGDQNQIKHLSKSDYATLDLNDPVLKLAYSAVFQTTVAGEFEALPEHLQTVLADMKRRGNAVSPLLLKLMDQNQETGFEISVLASVGSLRSVDVGPFAEYARRVLRERTSTMSASLAGVSAMLLSEQGGKDDLELLRQVMAKRPYVAASIKSELPLLEKRIAGASATPDTKAPSQPAPRVNVQPPAPKKAPEAKPTSRR